MSTPRFFRRSLAELVPYEPGKPVEAVQRELGLDRVVKLASNEGPFGPFPAALEALAAQRSELNRYPDGGAYALRSALAAKHGVSFEHVAMGAGADGVIDCLSQAVLEDGDEVVCGWPSFPSYVLDAIKLGARPVRVPLRDHRYDLEALLGAITPRTKLVYVCHPNNPTGTTNTRAELDAYMDQVPGHVLTVLDQAYFEYIDDPEYPDGVEEYFKAGRRVIVLRTFSKIFGLAGLRVGYGIAQEDVVTEIAKVRRAFDVSSAAQAAALASLGDEQELARRRAPVLRRARTRRGDSGGRRVRGRRPCSRQLRLCRHGQRRTCCLRRAVARGCDRAPAQCIRVGDGDPGDDRNVRGERVSRGGPG